MAKKRWAVLVTCAMLVGLTSCGSSGADVTTDAVSENAAEPEVIIREVEVEKEVKVVTKETIVLKEEEIVIDTVSEYTDAFQDNVDVSGREEVYFGKPRFFEDNDGITWTTENPEIAIVNEYGMVTALDEGVTTIRCFDDRSRETASYDIYCTTANDGQNVKTYTSVKNEREMFDFVSDHAPEELQADISTIRDVMWLLKMGNYQYDYSAPILANQLYTWAMSGESFLLNSGVCCDVANLAAYLLQYDYEELGFIYHHGTQIGHVYNYVYEDGYYYVFDLTEVISDSSDRGYQDFQIYKLDELEDFVDEILDWKTEPDKLLGVVAVNSLNHTEQPANYMSYMSNDKVIFQEYVEVGFEEGVPMEVLYVNPKAEGLFSYISIPRREIPNCIPSWFRSEIKEIRNWSLYD